MRKKIFELMSTLRTELRNHFPRLLPYHGKYIRTCEETPLPDNIIPGDETEVSAAHPSQPCKFRLDKNGEGWGNKTSTRKNMENIV